MCLNVHAIDSKDNGTVVFIKTLFVFRSYLDVPIYNAFGYFGSSILVLEYVCTYMKNTCICFLATSIGGRKPLLATKLVTGGVRKY